MAKKAAKKKTTTRKKAPRKKTSGAAPGPHILEQALGSVLGKGRDATFDAQQHAFDAMEAMGQQDWDQAQHSAKQAVDLDPNCVDALHILSVLGSESDEELIDHLRRTIERGKKGLGKKFFKENAGHFWGMIETRPYMRVQGELARLLASTGKGEEAITHWEEMLRLNPGDNQGIRYPLLGAYLETDNQTGAQQIFADYPDEGSAMFAWARVLANFLTGDEKSAARSLTAARKTNKHVEAFITGRKKLPKDPPGYYSPGEPSEAYVCVEEIGTAWKKHPEAMKWLKQQKPKPKKR